MFGFLEGTITTPAVLARRMFIHTYEQHRPQNTFYEVRGMFHCTGRMLYVLRHTAGILVPVCAVWRVFVQTATSSVGALQCVFTEGTSYFDV